MRKFLNSFTWAFLIVFSIPSVLIVASWNSLPGEALYTVKLGLEQSLLFVASPSVQAKESLQIHYTERRLSDAKRMLSEKHSVEGLPYLSYQVTSTKQTILQAPPGQSQKEAAQKYIATLSQASAELEQQKLTMTTSVTPPPSFTAVTPARIATQSVAGGPTLTPTPTSPPPTVTAQVTTTTNPPPTTITTALQISQTQETIKQTIDELKKVSEEENNNKSEKQDNSEKQGMERNKKRD